MPLIKKIFMAAYSKRVQEEQTEETIKKRHITAILICYTCCPETKVREW
jgi:hypothetical protein